MMGAANPYLTQKTLEKKRFAPLIVAVCMIFALGAGASIFDLLKEEKRLSAVMGVLLMAALLIPVVRIFAHEWRRLRARRIAEALLPITEESLTFDQLKAALSSDKALESVRSLIGKGYLQNLQIDLQQRTVALYTPEASFVEWLCPGCGAKNRARRGGALRCQYCSQPFSK